MLGVMSRNHVQGGGIKKPLIIGLGVGAAVIIIIVIVVATQCAGMFAGVKPVIEGFMTAGAANNTEASYAFWSPQSASEEEIAEFIEDNYNDLFAGYESLTISSYSGESSAGITTCEVGGAITYAGDQSLPFEASLVKQSGVWRITGIYIGY